MALRNQPYLPLYVQDFLTDEKLSECSAESTGVYIRLMCIMHKSEEYGTFLLKQKDKQTDKQIKNFALKLVKQMPYSEEIIEKSLTELLEENVLILDENKLIQKRMVRDNNISEIRSKSGKKGGKKTAENKNNFINDFAQAKVQANSEDDNEDDNENININIINYYIKYINLNIGSLELEKLEYWKTIYSDDIIKHAIDVAVYYQARNINYVDKVLSNWQKDGYKTLEEIKEKSKKKETEKVEKPIIDKELFEYDWLNNKEE